MKSVLLVFSKQDEVALQRPIFEAFHSAGVSIDPERNAGRAAERLEAKQYNYLVCGLHLAMDADSPVLSDGGLRLCEEARRLSPQLPIALIAPGRSNDVRLRAASLKPAPLVLADEDNLPQQLVELLDKVEVRPPRLDILIYALGQGDQWRYEMTGSDGVDKGNGFVGVDAVLLDAQRDLTTGILHAPSWYDSFDRLGRNILDGLRRTKEFDDHLRDGIKAVGGIDNTHLTFSVLRNHYQIALEAIRSPDEAPEPWMIHAPLVRNMRCATPANARLFEGSRGKLRCLVICADASGLVRNVNVSDDNGDPLVLKELDKVKDECQSLKELLKDSLIEVHPIGFAEDKEPVSVERLINVLKNPGKPRWDLIHYAGHSKLKYKENSDRKVVEENGYLFLGERNTPEAIEFSKVVSYMKRVKLLYLSSCQSGNAAFAVEAAHKGVPAVIGFRWSIPDTEASRHARLFYEALLKEQAIDTAFLDVRKAIHEATPKNNTWASSMLVMNG